MPPIDSLIEVADMSTVATTEPPLVKTRMRPDDPSVGVPVNVILRGGSGQRFCPFGGGNSDVTPAGRFPWPPCPVVPAVPPAPPRPVLPAAPAEPPWPATPVVPPRPAVVPAAPAVPPLPPRPAPAAPPWPAV